jgi:hypothetical protein
MVPNVPLRGLTSGESSSGWLNTLYASTRTCVVNRSVTRTFLKSARSAVTERGARSSLMPALPNVPGAGCAKAAGLNHSSPRPRLPDASGSPTRFHGCAALPVPTPAMSVESTTDSGAPELTNATPVTCQPPITLASRPRCWRRNGSS